MRFFIVFSVFLLSIFFLAKSAHALATPQVNVPYFSQSVDLNQTAIFWFGKVNQTDNYTDVRIGYTDSELYINAAIFDRLFWYDSNPSSPDLTSGDTITIYLNKNGALGSTPTQDSYKLVAQINWFEPRTNYQAIYQGNGTSWVKINNPFTTASRMRGNAPQDLIEDRGWGMLFRIPFSSLNLSSSPAQGSLMGLGVSVHDQDDAAKTPIPDSSWPGGFIETNPQTWGKLLFGQSTYNPPQTSNNSTIVIRHNLDGQIVQDGEVGGHTVCGNGLNFWSEWGEKNYLENSQINIQNQFDVADWPCFSKFYMSFPLNKISPGKAIVSAKLKMHLFGNAGAPGEAQPSYIQVHSTLSNFDESTINWNNAPQSRENISQTMVNPLSGTLIWPGVPYEWDVSKAISQAYTEGSPATLALYSSDGPPHSGKYFSSSKTGDWNAVARPTLEIVIGDLIDTPTLQGDIYPEGGDGRVDIFDYNQLLTDFGKTGPGLISDIEKNGSSADKVDIFDYNVLLTNFGSQRF